MILAVTIQARLGSTQFPAKVRGVYAWVAVAWTLLWAYGMIAMMGMAHLGGKVVLR